MDLRKVKKLIELFEDSELVEMEISEGESNIRLSRGGGAVSVMQAAPIPVPRSHPEPARHESTQDTNDGGTQEIEGSTIDSPMVGTFYDSSSPDTDPYVSVGSQVKAGDVLCIIEAMKTFNQLESEVSGTIRAVLKSPGDPVEYGEPLFVIDPE